MHGLIGGRWPGPSLLSQRHTRATSASPARRQQRQPNQRPTSPPSNPAAPEHYGAGGGRRDPGFTWRHPLMNGTYSTARGSCESGGSGISGRPVAAARWRLTAARALGADGCRVGSPLVIWLPWPPGSGGAWWVGGG